jgi:hypothetical protein
LGASPSKWGSENGKVSEPLKGRRVWATHFHCYSETRQPQIFASLPQSHPATQTLLPPANGMKQPMKAAVARSKTRARFILGLSWKSKLSRVLLASRKRAFTLTCERVSHIQSKPGLPWNPEPSSEALYNLAMADCIVCSCVTCPGCGTWVVVEREIARAGGSKDKVRTSCPSSECAKEFAFETNETRVFELPLPLFERRHFFRSELQ